MKKKTIIDLIRYHVDKNEVAFREEAYEVAKYFDETGDFELAQYVMGLISKRDGYIPQEAEVLSDFFTKVALGGASIPLPGPIFEDILGIANAISKNAGINRFLFQGDPGTGKTETAKRLAKMLERELFVVDFSAVIDSRLGQTQKNIVQLFDEINNYRDKTKVIFLFDEIDALAMDRTNANDLREMGRATSTFLRCMDTLSSEAVLLATTNLFNYLDSAIKRRFDAIVDFNRYTQKDTEDAALAIVNFYVDKYQAKGRKKSLIQKVLNLSPRTLTPGELKNLIKTAIVFSNNQEEYDYIRRFYRLLVPNGMSIDELRAAGMTTRDIEVLTGVSKSQVARKLQKL